MERPSEPNLPFCSVSGARDKSSGRKARQMEGDEQMIIIYGPVDYRDIRSNDQVMNYVHHGGAGAILFPYGRCPPILSKTAKSEIDDR